MPPTLYRVEGQVSQTDGAPAAGAGLSIVQSSTAMPEITRVVDQSGKCEMHLPAGTYTFEAISGDSQSRTRTTIEVPKESSFTLRFPYR